MSPSNKNKRPRAADADAEDVGDNILRLAQERLAEMTRENDDLKRAYESLQQMSSSSSSSGASSGASSSSATAPAAAPAAAPSRETLPEVPASMDMLWPALMGGFEGALPVVWNIFEQRVAAAVETILAAVREERDAALEERFRNRLEQGVAEERRRAAQQLDTALAERNALLAQATAALGTKTRQLDRLQPMIQAMGLRLED